MPVKEKAIIIARKHTQANPLKNIQEQKEKLLAFTEANNFEVTEIIEDEEAVPLFQSGAFLQVLKNIQNTESKVYIIFFNEGPQERSSEIETRFSALTSKNLLETIGYSHPCFTEPEKEDQKIWRYVTLPKFLDLIQAHKISFTRADILRKDDQSESRKLTKHQRTGLEALEKIDQEIDLGNGTKMKASEFARHQLRFANDEDDFFIKSSFINCWHMNDLENFAMWKIYSDDYGVCIQSTFSDLCKSLNGDEWSFMNRRKKVYIGKVRYINWESASIPMDNALWPAMHKRTEFTYENELRCVILDTTSNELEFLKVEVDVSTLINNIYINPFAPPWFKDVIINLCVKYGLPKEVVNQSKLSTY